jgi:hypothetical protein
VHDPNIYTIIIKDDKFDLFESMLYVDKLTEIDKLFSELSRFGYKKGL